MAEFQKFIFFYSANKSELFRPHAYPLTSNSLFLAVIVPKLQMLFEVFFGIAQVGLYFDGQHAQLLPQIICEVVAEPPQP
jgi:hypothetical protein